MSRPHSTVPLLAAAAAAALVGCQCSLDTSKLDAIACGQDADCPPDQRCFAGSCSHLDCEEAADCPDGWDVSCDEGRCFATGCSEGADDCPEGFACVGDYCRADLVACQVDEDCDDRSYCNGVERCEGGVCGPGEAVDCGPDPAECQRSVCDETQDTCVVEPAANGADCDDHNPCTGPDLCRDEVCAGAGDACDDDLACTTGECIAGVGCVVVDGACAIDEACWADGEGPDDDPCSVCDPATDPRAWSPSGAASCDDGDDCTSDDTCRGTTCAGTPYTCDDGLGCTIDVCDGAGGCGVALRAGTCLIAGACAVDGDENPLQVCQKCDAAVDPNHWSPNDAGTPSDGIDCTVDSCAAGQPVFAPNDGRCGGQVCAPCAGGCATPPTLQVACDAAPGAPGGPARNCTITGSADDACLSCSSRIGLTSLVADTFDGCPGLQGLGWTVSGAPYACASDRLEFGNGSTTLTRTVDTRDLDSVRLCFGWTDLFAGQDDTMTVQIDAGAGFLTIWTGVEGPYANTDREVERICLDLVAAAPAAADNAALRVQFIVDCDGGIMRLDDVAVDGWTAAHLSWPGRVIDDGFAGCDLGDWTPGNGDNVICPADTGPLTGQEALEARASTWEITRSVDVSDRCDDVRVGFQHAVHSVQFPVDYARLFADSGAGEQQWFGSTGTNRVDDVFLEQIVPISLYDPDARFQDALRLRFELTTGGPGRQVWIDDVWLDGAVCANGDDWVTVGAPVGAGNGTANVTVSSDVQTTANVECTWNDLPSTLARGRALFRY